MEINPSQAGLLPEAVKIPDSPEHTPMKPEIKKRWVEALLSGEWPQGRAHLKTPEGYCCLAVLCEVYGIDHDIGFEEDDDGSNGEFLGEEDYLPEKVMEWSGISKSNPSAKNFHKTLAELNDAGHSFKDIAKVIDTYM